MKRNQSINNLMHSIPFEPVFFSSFLKKHYQARLNDLLINSMESFNYPTFKLALYLGADPNIDVKSQKDYHLVTRCARSGEALFLDTLLNFGGHVEANVALGGYTPLHMSATKNMVDSIEVLVRHGANIHAVYKVQTDYKKKLKGSEGWTPLICACLHNKTAAGKKLLDLGANPFDKNEKGLNAVTICLNMKNQELADYILEKQKTFNLDHN